MERLPAARRLRERAMELELQHLRQEVARVRRIGGHVVLRAGIEELFAAR